MGRIVAEDSFVYSWKVDSSAQFSWTESYIWNLPQVAFVGDGPSATIVAWDVVSSIDLYARENWKFFKIALESALVDIIGDLTFKADSTNFDAESAIDQRGVSGGLVLREFPCVIIVVGNIEPLGLACSWP